MYKRVSYNTYTNTVHLWETEDGRTSHKELHPEIAFYHEDKSKKSNIKDIYGNPVVKKVVDSFQAMKAFKETGIKCCETDISPTTRFLQEYYKDVELKVDMKNINICYIDIEVSTDINGGFDSSHKIRVRPKL